MDTIMCCAVMCMYLMSKLFQMTENGYDFIYDVADPSHLFGDGYCTAFSWSQLTVHLKPDNKTISGNNIKKLAVV